MSNRNNFKTKENNPKGPIVLDIGEQLDGVSNTDDQDKDLPRKGIPIVKTGDDEMDEIIYGLARAQTYALENNKKVWLEVEYESRDGWIIEEGVLFQVRWPIFYLDKKDENGKWKTCARRMRRADWNAVSTKYVSKDEIEYPKYWRKKF
jgi:hypothetical protein